MIADHLAAAIASWRMVDEIAALKRHLEIENEELREEVNVNSSFGDLIGASPAINLVTRQIELVANTDSTVLILGESGTGKEVVAREIHRCSRRESAADQGKLCGHSSRAVRERVLWAQQRFVHRCSEQY